MDRTGAVFAQRFHVPFSKISFMHVEPILRIQEMVFKHCMVPCNFCEYRGSTYCRDCLVTLNNCLDRDRQLWRMVSVYEDHAGLHTQTLYSTLHCKQCCMKNIQSFDLFQTRLLYTPT